eukprot:COSAG02_NODE_1137_length_14313_cov_6.111369_9_plen_100_part_00
MLVLYTNSRSCYGMDVQVTSVPIDSDTLAALGAFQFNIALKVPWVMRSIVVRDIYFYVTDSSLKMLEVLVILSDCMIASLPSVLLQLLPCTGWRICADY